MNFSNQQQEPDETGIDLTPLIDVVFLLLIFFMISTTFAKQSSLKIKLPEAQQEQQDEQANTIEVYISANAMYAIASDNDASAKTLVNSNRKTLAKALGEFKGNKNQIIVIKADKKAPHGAVIKVLDVAQNLGFSNISFATKQGGSE